MTHRYALEAASCTDPGLVRSFNEDSIALDAEAGLLVLADGMGGYKAGDVASQLATGLILEQIKERRPGMGAAAAVSDAVRRANTAIFEAAQADARYQGMGTTLVLLLVQDGRAIVGHVGDSRLYRLRRGQLELITQDHSLLREQVEQGLITAEDARVSHNRNLVTRALGVEPEVELELTEQEVLPEDIYLLCSDGLNDMVDDADIALVLASLKSNLPLAAQQLVMIANDNGGHDNVSVMLARVTGQPAVPRGWFARVLGWFGSGRE
jgi:protein phosphatase